MYEVYADIIGVLQHLKLEHLLFAYDNIWWQEEKYQYQGIYKYI